MLKRSFLNYLISRISWMLIFSITTYSGTAQDTLTINEVTVATSLVKQTLLRSTTAAAVIDSARLSTHSVTSLVSTLNTVPGVRMEERSPGSYRLSLRGSLLRSPFGVRNVKIYLNEYPLTDAGGNSYLNVIGPAALRSIDILKGPDGSLFGANSGGVISLHTPLRRSGTTAEITGGSYGLIKQTLNYQKVSGSNALHLSESFQRADGYRKNSALQRWYFHADDEWQYTRKMSINTTAFYGNLNYETPGGLTLSQFEADRRQARPATPALPGASEQQAAVSNQMLFLGLTHKTILHTNVEHVLSVSGTRVDFKNPFITNYEEREEKNLGLRTYFTVSTGAAAKTGTFVDYTAGVELQRMNSTISNYRNNKGTKGALLAAGQIKTGQDFIFNRIRLNVRARLTLEAGVSLNFYKFTFEDSALLKNRFTPQWMPRFAVNYLAAKNLSFRSSLSKGYSPPTTAEIRPSDNNIYPNLQAERGFNLEIGARYFPKNNRYAIDISVYKFRLKNAIVRQQNASGDEYFLNAGSVKHKGLEVQADLVIIKQRTERQFIRQLKLLHATTLSDFRFSDYVSIAGNFSGKRLTGVPQRIFVSSLLAEINNGFYVFFEHNYTGKLPLTDSNEFFAASYHILFLKFGYRFKIRKALFEVNAGSDNLSNENYSLGNDLNAAGNRFYNAAPSRNYFGGVKMSL